MLRTISYLLLVVGCLLLISCARTVTPLVTYGEEMQVTVTLRGNVETNQYRYFLIVSSEANYALPLPAPDLNLNAPELIEPGSLPLQGSPEAYYDLFYRSWAGYIVLDNTAQYYLVKGPFALNQTNTREVLSSPRQANQTLSFSCRLGRLFPGGVPTNIYFDFVTVNWPDGQLKLPADHLLTTNNYLSTISGTIQTIDDLSDSSLPAGLDITRCQVQIQ